MHETSCLGQVSSGCALPKTFNRLVGEVLDPSSRVCDHFSGQTGNINWNVAAKDDRQEWRGLRYNSISGVQADLRTECLYCV